MRSGVKRSSTDARSCGAASDLTVDNRLVRTPRSVLAVLPLLARAVVIGTASAGVVGAIIGLVVGLRTYAPTAPFAVVELGLPAAIMGAVAGLAIGSIILAIRRIAR